MEEECVFCKIISGEISSQKVFENTNFIGILDVHPISEGHTLLIPKKHYETILDMPPNLGDDLVEAIKKIANDLINREKAEGFNVIQSNKRVAQQDVLHLHFHIVPRKKGDGLKWRFK